MFKNEFPKGFGLNKTEKSHDDGPEDEAKDSGIENGASGTVGGEGDRENARNMITEPMRIRGIWTGPEFTELVPEVLKVFGPGEDESGG